MMKKSDLIKLAWMPLVLALLLAGCAMLPGSANAPADGINTFTGFLEGSKVDVAPQVGARLTSVNVQEGDTIQAGQKLVTLEDDLIRARIQAADANVAAAEAQLALLQAGARKEEIASAQAKVDQAQAALDAAAVGLKDAQEIRANPQAMTIAQAQAAAHAKTAEQQLAAAVAQAQAADAINQFWEEQTRMLWDGVTITLPSGGTLHFDTPGARQVYAQEQWSKAGNDAWQAWAGVKQAQAQSDAARAALDDVNSQIVNPILLDTKVDQARGAKDRAAAALATAQAGLQVLRDGASPSQIQAARAAVDQAHAARAALDEEMGHYAVDAPQAGTVSSVYYRQGEIALPGVPVITLSVAGDLTLRVYVPMSTLDRVHLGETVSLSVEGISGRTFPGTVTLVNSSAEFSGRQAQTDSERNAQLVAIEITVKDVKELKPGMPASVSFK